MLESKDFLEMRHFLHLQHLGNMAACCDPKHVYSDICSVVSVMKLGHFRLWTLSLMLLLLRRMHYFKMWKASPDVLGDPL